ncbi:hypothetical protein [Chitinophaga sp. CF418]|uniref:hypothetical protein n=1 Tax=Chitinophaga sp. CF418 TaxID=1855287 RepID=UPI0009247985|nr:hypothetical protein [Chitinophaga sp. CF418]SHN24492.1 hypothetical protein SAMN05216311_107257 [Chitinophaga sp. CF418]
MRNQLAWDFLGEGYSAADYLASDPYFSDLFGSGDITTKYENGQKYWYFSEFAARYLTAYAFNLAAISIVAESSSADAANPLNTMAQLEFRTRAQQILRSFIPGASVQSSLRTTTNTNALYGTACQY